VGSAATPEAPRRMTAEELFDLPDDGMRRELVEGELRGMTPAGAVAHAPGGVAHLLRRDDLLEGGDVLPGFTRALPDLFVDD
jgi:hypothetical protein